MSGGRSGAPIGLVLAAGAGTRLGHGPKALLPFRGATLLEHVVGALLAGGCPEVVVVTGAEAERAAEAVAGRAAVRAVENRAWRDGMGTSLRTGLRAVAPGRHVLVTPVDRPGLGAEEVARVIAAHRPGALTAAAHRDGSGQLRRGHPVLLDACWVEAAAQAAHDDVGARELLRAQHEIVTHVDCTDLEDGGDVDAPSDLWRLDAAR